MTVCVKVGVVVYVHNLTQHVSKPDVPVENPSKKKSTTTTQHIETLNPGASNVSAGSPAEPSAKSDSDDEEAPSVTPVMKQFASLPTVLKDIPLSLTSFPDGFNPAKELKLDLFQQAFQYLGQHKELLHESYGTSDALFLQAFESQMAGQKALARMCTEKALLVQYCNKLGPDGVSLFFRRYVAI